MLFRSVVKPLLVSELFGGKDYVALLGFLQAGACIGSCLSPLLISGIYDKTGSYTLGWGIIGASLAVALGLMMIVYFKNAKLVKKKEALDEVQPQTAEEVI